MDIINASNNEEKDRTRKLSKAQQIEFQRLLKQGVYKELHQKGMLTDMQLSDLLHCSQYPL